MSETGYLEDCCWNDIRDQCPLRQGGPCRCRCHMDNPEQPVTCAHDQEIAQLRAQLQRWEEFDFERDNPRRLTEHVLALMIERDTWRQRAEAAEANLEAARPATGELGGEEGR